MRCSYIFMLTVKPFYTDTYEQKLLSLGQAGDFYGRVKQRRKFVGFILNKI